jgi:hypothetical protein
MPSPVVLLIVKNIKSVSVRTQLNYIYYTELHVSTYLRLSSGSQLVFKTYWGRSLYHVSNYNTKLKLLKLLWPYTGTVCVDRGSAATVKSTVYTLYSRCSLYSLVASYKAGKTNLWGWFCRTTTLFVVHGLLIQDWLLPQCSAAVRFEQACVKVDELNTFRCQKVSTWRRKELYKLRF